MKLNELRENRTLVYTFLAIAFFIPGLAYQCAFHLDQLIAADWISKIASIISKSILFFMISFLYEMIVSSIKIKKGKYPSSAVSRTLVLTSIDIISCSFISMIIVWILTFFMALGNEYQYLRIIAAYFALHIIMFISEIILKKKPEGKLAKNPNKARSRRTRRHNNNRK